MKSFVNLSDIDKRELRKIIDHAKKQKKKDKKNITNGIAYVQSTFNNTIVSIADTNGNVVS